MNQYMLSAIVIDDEILAVRLLKGLLEKTGQVCVVGAFTTAAQALSYVQNLKLDVAFIDIEMPEMSGLELAKKIKEASNDVEIIFVTAYDKYALEAFRVNAIDYILKPASSDDISKIITRLKKIRSLQTSLQVPADKGRIYCFSRLLVYGAGSGTPIRWRTSKAEELFAFFVTKLNVEVSKWIVIDTLWPECEPGKVSGKLHTTIYQAKQSLLVANIKFDFSYINGKYKLELPEIFIDAAELEAVTNTRISLSETSVEKYKRVLSLYKGNYLEENGYLWSQSIAKEYFIRYRSLVSKLFKYYVSERDYINAERILQEALNRDPLDEDLNIMLLELFLMKKNKVAFIKHYNKIKELYEAELGIIPNAIMQDLFYRAFEL